MGLVEQERAPVHADDGHPAAGRLHGHLSGLGHRGVALIDLDRDQAWATRRRAAFRGRFGAGQPRHALAHADAAERGGIAAFLRAHPEVTAVVASTDHVALPVIAAARADGVRVPEDLSVCGYGNMVFDASTTALTTVEQRPYRVGRAAAEHALRPDPGRRLIEVPGELVERASSGRPPSR